VAERVAHAPDASLRNQTASARFRRELDRAVELISERPEAGPPYIGIARRFLLRRFPFFVVYRVLGEHIQIVAVAHARRRPGYWRER
jgi:toxin ParE1/3/4